jgi:hypothetical protein
VFVAAMMVGSQPAAALYVVAVAVMLLLYTGVHNAWDSAIYIGITRAPSERPSTEPNADATPSEGASVPKPT